ncbi:PTS sugar transporter subunit IIA [Malonomonas rubra]|uniref:PTS sugar transporter subunit IIA n=1 Tax=Malonomonas rubra TaxID=57040 RepID=UPI0026E980E4|nr:PTS sugar transporter subunit IIA [Malonomonas rubra]
MIGIVVITHSSLAYEFIKAAEMIVGSADQLQAVSIDRSIGIETVQHHMREVLDEVGRDGDGIIILTDMFGGTPTNVSAEFLKAGQVEIVTGVNLPMLLKSISAREGKTVGELAELLKDYGQKAVMRPAEML